MLQSADEFRGEFLNRARHGRLLRPVDRSQELLRPGASLIRETYIFFTSPVLGNQDDNPLPLPLSYNCIHRCLGDQPLLADLLIVRNRIKVKPIFLGLRTLPGIKRSLSHILR